MADALIAMIASRRWPLKPFIDLLEARSFDLYDDPMPGRAQLEGYLGETRSALIQLGCLVLDPTQAQAMADRAGHAGCAIGVVEILNGLWSGRTRPLVPLDILNAAGVDPEGFRAGVDAARTVVVSEALIALAREHLGRTETVPPSFRPAFAKASLARPMLKAVERVGSAIYREPMALSPLRRQWTMMRFGMTGRV